MAYFHIYADESGKLSGKSDYTCLCGYVAHVQEWNRVGLEWDACRFRWQVPPLHMSRIMAPDKKDDEWKKKKEEWGDLWERKRDGMLEEFATIIQRASIACVGAVIDAVAYRKIKEEPDCLLHHKDTNVFAFHHLIMRSLEKIETIDRTSPVSVVVDDDQQTAMAYYEALNTLRTHWHQQFKKVNERLVAICYGRDAAYPGLQAADMIAFVSRRLKLDKDEEFEQMPYSLYPSLTMGGIHQPKLYTEDIIRKVARGTFEHTQKANGDNCDGI